MKFFWALIFTTVTFSLQGQSAFDKMTNEKLSKILHREAENIEGTDGRWQCSFKELRLFVLTDQDANRMRIMTPIVEEKELKKGQYKMMLEANFDRALDAKYSIYQEVVWSIYTHPLGELSVEQFKDALDQVATLSRNFGSSYASTYWTFGDSDN